MEALVQLEFLAGVKSPQVAKRGSEWEREGRRGTDVSYQFKFQMSFCQLLTEVLKPLLGQIFSGFLE